MGSAAMRPKSCLVYLAECERLDVKPSETVAGLSLAERVFRAAARAQFQIVIVWAPTCRAFMQRHARSRAGTLDIILCSTRDEWLAAVNTLGDISAVPVVGAGVVVSPALLEDARNHVRRAGSAAAHSARGGLVVNVPAGPAFSKSGVFVAPTAALTDLGSLQSGACCQDADVRMPDGPEIAAGHARLVARLNRRADLPSVERTVRRAIYKPTDPFLARFNRRLSIPVSVWLIRHTRLSANALSILLVALAALAAWFLSRGSYGWSVAGAVLSLVASILDGCDGEIARLTYTQSKLGCWIETVGDYVYYLAVLAGLSIGVMRSTGLPLFAWIGFGIIAGTLVTFALLIVLRRSATGGRPERLQQIIRQPFDASEDRWARLVGQLAFVGTRSTMPYGIAAFALLGALPFLAILAFVAAQAYWISLAVKWGQLLPRRLSGRYRGSLSAVTISATGSSSEES